MKGNFEEPVAVLFASFKKWAELMSEPPLSSKAFSSKPFYAFDFVPVPFCSFRDSRSVRSVRAAKSIQKGETTAKTHRSGHRITSRGLPPVGIQLLSSKSRPPHRGKITGQRRKAVLARVERRGPAQADGGGQTSVLDQRGVDLLAFVFIAQSLKEVGCPMVDAVRAKRRHQAVPAVLAFFERHGVGARDGGGGRFNIVGVDDQGAF